MSDLPSSWRSSAAFCDFVQSSKAQPSLENLTREEEMTLRFGYWCWCGGRERLEQELKEEMDHIEAQLRKPPARFSEEA